MKYTTEVTVNASREEFLSKLRDPENMKHWMEGISHYEHQGDMPAGQVGAKMLLVFSKPKIEMVETILEDAFPDRFRSSYTTSDMVNTQAHTFSQTPDGQTRWVLENEFTTNKLMMRIMMKLMPGMFKKQTLKYLNNFKAFVEEGKSIAL